MNEKEMLIEVLRAIDRAYTIVDRGEGLQQGECDAFLAACEKKRAQAQERVKKEQTKRTKDLPALPTATLPAAVPPEAPEPPRKDTHVKGILIGPIAALLAIVLAAFWFLCVIIPPLGEALGGWIFLLVVLMLGSAIGWIACCGDAEEILAWRQKQQQWEADMAKWEQERALAALDMTAFAAYEQAFSEMIAACRESAAGEYERIAKEMPALRAEYLKKLQEQRVAVLEASRYLVEAEKVIDRDDFPYANRLANALVSGAADTLEEAFAIVNQQLLEEAEEAERRAEEAQREYEAREREREEREHRYRMEEAANRQARAAEQQARAMEQAARDAERRSRQQEYERRQAELREQSRQSQAAAAKCRSCMRTGCSMAARQNSLTCSAFMPRNKW